MDARTFSSRLTLAIPKQGKLKKPIIQYLEERDFTIEGDEESGFLLDNQSSLPPIRIEFVRAADALVLLEEKVADFAIIGSDVVDENTIGSNPAFPKPQKKLDLSLAKCCFKLAVPDKKSTNFASPKSLDGLTIVTSYPNLLEAWLKENNVTPKRILVREGGVESSIRMGIADAAADLVDTGSTLRKNNLTAIFDITRTSAACYTSAQCDMAQELLVNEFLCNLKNRVPKQRNSAVAAAELTPMAA